MRSFSKKEIQKILAKAAELEMAHSLDDKADQLSESEILELAKEAGISSSSIKTALISYDSPQFENKFDWLKGTSRIQHVEKFDTPLQSDQIAKVLRLLQSRENELGETELQPKKLEWSSAREIESLKVSLFEQDGKTSFTYSSDWTPFKFVLASFPFIILFMITLVSMKGMGFDKYTGLLFAPFGGMLGLTGGWLYLRQKFEKQKKRLVNILDEIRALLLRNENEKPSIQIDEKDHLEESTTDIQNKVRA